MADGAGGRYLAATTPTSSPPTPTTPVTSEISDQATRRAVRDLLAAAVTDRAGDQRLDLEFARHLQSALTQDAARGATPAQLLRALLPESGPQPLIYARLLELAVTAQLDEITILAEIPEPDRPPQPQLTRQPVTTLRRTRRRR